MATQSYIIAREAILIDAIREVRTACQMFDFLAVKTAARELREALEYEQATGGIPANRDYWGTAHVNALVLSKIITSPDVKTECERFASLAKQELGFN